MKDYMFYNYMKDCYMDSMCDEDSMNRPLCNMCGLTPLCPQNNIMPSQKDSKDIVDMEPIHMEQNICDVPMEDNIHYNMYYNQCMQEKMQDSMYMNPGMQQGMYCPMMCGFGGMYPTMMAGYYGMHPMMYGCGGMQPMMAGCGEMFPAIYNREMEFEEFDLDEE